MLAGLDEDLFEADADDNDTIACVGTKAASAASCVLDFFGAAATCVTVVLLGTASMVTTIEGWMLSPKTGAVLYSYRWSRDFQPCA